MIFLLFWCQKVDALNFDKLIWFSAIETDRMQSINIYNNYPNQGHDIHEVNSVVRDLSKDEYFIYNQMSKYGIWELKEDYKLAYYLILINQIYTIIQNDKILKKYNKNRKIAISYGFEF